jgi:ATP-binding cassette subfamily F protein 3
LLQLKDIYYSIGNLDLLKQVNWVINPGKRVALIGPNGAGKTTLLRIIAGEIEPTSGGFLKPRDYSIGYLPQEEITLENGSVIGIALEGHSEILGIEEEMDRIHGELDKQSDDPDQQLLERLGILESRYSVLGGYTLEADAKKVLIGLGFQNSDFHRPMSDLSGGWRMRAYLARLLIQQPNLLLLDEPTNHLDIDSLEWMENYLRNFSGSMIIVSHDRFFIDRLAHEIAELQFAKLTHYSGNYRFYEKKKALVQEQLIKKWEEQKEERQRIQKFIDRFRYKNTKAAQVQSRIKQLEKMEQIELPEPPKTIYFKIQADAPSYREVLKIENMSFRYDQKWVLENINFNLYRGEKIALVGVNGAGKTTFTRLISDELKPQKGIIKIGERVHIGYYAQHQVERLNLNNSIMEEVAESAAPSFQPKLRDILGIFKFTGDDVEKRIGVLSGGEKARVSLAKILLSPCNFLIMDEPTNHLDLSSKEALESALKDYDGTVLLISHDRYFLDKLVTRVIELQNGHLKEYAGNYSDYLAKKESQIEEQPVNGKRKTEPINDIENISRNKKTKEQKQKEAVARQAVSKERNDLLKKISELESEIESLEKQRSEMETHLANPATYQNPEKAAQLKIEYDALCARLPQLEASWEEVQLRYEEILSAI